MHDVRGTTALITGASKGLGAAYATELARRGSALVLVARNATALDELAARLRAEHGVAVTVLAADLTAPDGAADLLDRVDALDLTVDLLLNNAGAGATGPFLPGDLSADLASITLNVSALVTLTHAFGRRMAARGSGSIVNVASTAAFQPLPYQATYAASKAFVLSFTEAVAEELRGTGVRVLAAHPGATATGFFDGTTHSMDPRITDDPHRVAARTIDDLLRGRAASYPGRPLFRAMTWAGRFTSRQATVRLAGAMNRRVGLHEARSTAGQAF